MNKFIKRIVPILLALSVIACAAWYITVYDREFTRDMLLAQARYLDMNGRQEMATWFYDQAYLFANNDEDVAIELAEQYRSNGNYTKAEFTLTRAIANSPSVKLYTALCQTYVEQDKLMDAVNMLDKISDPVIRAEIEKIRPTAPSVNLAPAYYTEYISLDFTAENGTIYLSFDGEFPSVREDLYSGTVTLPEGETNIFALTIGENGLVSPRATYGYTIGGIIEAVTFADPAIEAEVRKVLGLDQDTVIYTNDLWKITSFSVPNEAVVYSDLARMIYLKDLTIYNAVSDELACLASLTELESLFITDCQPSKETLTAIAAMEHLTSLTIAQCDLSDISPLSNAQKLEYLDLSYNSIRNVGPIGSLPSLKTLHMAHNALTDLSDLTGLSALEVLNVSYNSLTTLAPICLNTSLKEIQAGNNQLTTVGALNNLPALQKLDLSHNYLKNISTLGKCENLTDVNISNNKIMSISDLAVLKNLRKLDCSYNTISMFPNWDGANTLAYLDASYNKISDLTPLRQMPCLNILNMEYNPELSSIEPIAYCPVLIEVNLFGTKVIDVDILTKQSIIVHYNPTEVEIDVGGEEESDPTDPSESTDPTEEEYYE